VILKEQFKKALKKDVYGFFASEAIYKELAIPWKRGIIMYGPPGNGKTISIKTIMKTCDEAGFLPLYVKSFQSWQGEEAAMAEVFNKARQESPCVIIFEDLDSLITDKNRSFFLNELDGLEGNDGLLVIGTTNHFEKLDPALSTRPSRFDRKYLFDDPDRDERALYAQYWQKKLENNKAVEFPDSLVDEIAAATTKFSFAYLKEAFVSSLVTMASDDDENKSSFAKVLMGQIKTLRKQLDKTPEHDAAPAGVRDVRVLLDALSESVDSARQNSRQERGHSGRDVRVLLDALSDSVAKSDLISAAPPRPLQGVEPLWSQFNPNNTITANRTPNDPFAGIDFLQASSGTRSSSERIYTTGLPSATPSGFNPARERSTMSPYAHEGGVRMADNRVYMFDPLSSAAAEARHRGPALGQEAPVHCFRRGGERGMPL